MPPFLAACLFRVTQVTYFASPGGENRSMTTTVQNVTVGEIAARTPAAVRVFEKYRIDFCCGGKVPLDEACRTAGVDPAALLAEIEQAGVKTDDARDWRSADLDALMDHILETHHAYLKTELPRLEARLAKIRAAHDERYGGLPSRMAAVFGPMKEELEAHLMKEEMVLFPLIRGLGTGQPSHCGTVRNPLRVMLMEHESAGGALAELRQITSGYAVPEGACNTFRAFYHELEALEADLHRHIHLENNILFPGAIERENAIN
jgi:regulator of cell morphogenesis and NO signaling